MSWRESESSLQRSFWIQVSSRPRLGASDTDALNQMIHAPEGLLS
jgi:hypothetical protein